jgi:translation elongation factor Ts
MAEHGWAIFAVIVIDGVFSFLQEYRAERAVEALQAMLPAVVTVRRSARPLRLAATALVPGDIVELAEGDQVPAELIDKERAIYSAQAADSGKPADIVAKMVEGRINKYLAEVTLLGQPFAKDTEQTVEKYLKSKGATVRGFALYVVGEGIEKKKDDFAAEVAAMAKA